MVTSTDKRPQIAGSNSKSNSNSKIKSGTKVEEKPQIVQGNDVNPELMRNEYIVSAL